MAVTWIGTQPVRCDSCYNKLEGVFIDGRTTAGPWGILCPDCHELIGVGLGAGCGQKYEKQDNGDWLKTDG